MGFGHLVAAIIICLTMLKERGKHGATLCRSFLAADGIVALSLCLVVYRLREVKAMSSPAFCA